MGFLTNWVFWVILAVIVFLMAIIGFLAEGSIFKKKDKTTIGNDNTDSDSTVSSVQTPDAFAPLKSASVPSTPETLNVNPVNMPQAEMLNVSPITDNNLNNEKTENVHQSSEDIFNEVPDTLQEVKIETLDDNLQTSDSENNQNEEVNQMPNTPENGTDIWNM